MEGSADPFESYRRLLRQLVEPSSTMRKQLQDLARLTEPLRGVSNKFAQQDAFRQFSTTYSALQSNLQRQLQPFSDARYIERLRRQLGSTHDRRLLEQLAHQTRAADLSRLEEASRQWAREWNRFASELSDRSRMELLGQQLDTEKSRWDVLLGRTRPFGDPQQWRAFQRQLAALQDVAVLDELRKRATDPPSTESLQRLREETVALDEVIDTLAEIGDQPEEGATEDELGWVDSLPVGAALRLFLIFWEWMTVAVSVFVATGQVPPTVFPALTAVQKLLERLLRRIEDRSSFRRGGS